MVTFDLAVRFVSPVVVCVLCKKMFVVSSGECVPGDMLVIQSCGIHGNSQGHSRSSQESISCFLNISNQLPTVINSLLKMTTSE